MVSSTTSRAKAAAANQDLDLVVKAGMSFNNGISKAVVEYYLEDKPLNIINIFSDSLLQSVSTAMAVGNLMGQRRSLLNVGLSTKDWDTSLSLDRFSEIRRLLEGKGLLQELDRLQKGYARDIYSDLYQIGSNVDAKVRFAIAQVVAKTRDKRRGLQEVKRILRSIGYDKGNPYQIKTLYETAISRSYGKGRWDRDHSAGVWKLFWGYEYVTMRDDRVRPSHQVLDGTTLPKDNVFWQTYWPPNGWNCRCIVVPITKRRKQYQPINPPPPDKGFGYKGFELSLSM